MWMNEAIHSIADAIVSESQEETHESTYLLDWIVDNYVELDVLSYVGYSNAPLTCTVTNQVYTSKVHIPKTLNNANLFIHSDNRINLSNPDLVSWGMSLLRKDLLVNSQGVVVHVGKANKLSIKDAKELLKKNILTLLKEGKGKLLLETPAGKGNEVLTTYESFSMFYKGLAGRVGVCIDTCHVFSTGYNPLIYLVKWCLEHGCDSVGLVHFNDSMYDKGCMKDRHAAFGNGCIPQRDLLLVIVWCQIYNIRMVREY